jgi:hypothetical protein
MASTALSLMHEQLEAGYRMIRERLDALDSAHTAAAAFEQLDEGHALLRDDLARLTDDELDRPRATNWGEQWPAWKIFWTMIHHDIHHGAEIGTLRDLDRVTREAAASGAPS